MLPIQIIFLVIIALFIFRTVNGLLKKKLHTQDFFLWVVFWGVVAAIVVWPNATQKIANMIGIGRGADLVVYLGLMGLYFFFYHTLIKVKQLDEKITKLGREIAIKGAVDTTKK